MKSALAVVVGYVVWTAIWLAGNAGLVSAGLVRAEVRVEAVGALGALLGLSLLASLAAGWSARAIARAWAAPTVVAVLLLATGLAVQWANRSLAPGWYHGLFLVLLVPATLAGGGLARGRVSQAGG